MGGSSKDSKYEAERSSIPITLVTLPQILELLAEHYERMSPTGTARLASVTTRPRGKGKTAGVDVVAALEERLASDSAIG